MKRLLLLIFMPIVLSSCMSKTFDNKEALWSYLKDAKNGYLHQKTINGFEFSLLYKPTDLMVDQELPESLKGKERDQKIKELRNKYHQYLYFTLSMSKNGQELLSTTPRNRQEFGAMVNQLAFGMGEKVHLFTSQKDTLDLLDYNYPRMYGMGGATTMLFVYPRDAKYLEDDYVNFTIEDLGIYTGEVKFKIPTEKLNKELTIKFDSK